MRMSEVKIVFSGRIVALMGKRTQPVVNTANKKVFECRKILLGYNYNMYCTINKYAKLKNSNIRKQFFFQDSNHKNCFYDSSIRNIFSQLYLIPQLLKFPYDWYAGSILQGNSLLLQVVIVQSNTYNTCAIHIILSSTCMKCN